MGRSTTVEPTANRRLYILLHGTAPVRNVSGTGASRSVAGTDSPMELVSYRRDPPSLWLSPVRFHNPILHQTESARWSECAIITVPFPTANRLGANHVVDSVLDLRRHLDRLESTTAGLGQVFAGQGRRCDQGRKEPGWRLNLRYDRSPRRRWQPDAERSSL